MVTVLRGARKPKAPVLSRAQKRRLREEHAAEKRRDDGLRAVRSRPGLESHVVLGFSATDAGADIGAVWISTQSEIRRRRYRRPSHAG